MVDSLINIAVQVSATLLLGAFFGLERRLRGYPDASLFHAVIAAFGLMAMIWARPQAASLVSVMAVAIGLSFLIVIGIRNAMQSMAESPGIFAASGADAFTLAGALSVGCACGTGDVRSVAAVIMIMALVSIFRPLETYSGNPLASGSIDVVRIVPRVNYTPAANDDGPVEVLSGDPAAVQQVSGDPLGR